MTVCITGSSRGIGQALSEIFCAHDHTVVGGMRNTRDGALLAEKFPRQFFPVTMDVTNPDSLLKARKEIADRLSGIDILVNNAGILPTMDIPSFEEVLTDDILLAFQVNTLGPLQVTQALFPLLQKSSDPLVVNVSSVMGSLQGVSSKRAYAYSISKAALNMLSRIMQQHLMSDMRVCVLHPGWVRTDMGGPTAPLSTEESTTEIYRTITAWKTGDPNFIDYRGKAVDW